MAKPSTHNILLTDAEYEWLAKAVPRHARSLKVRVENAPSRSSKRLLTFTERLADKLATPPEERDPSTQQLIFTSNRQDLRIIQQIVGVEHGVVVTKVIPGYADRMVREPRLKEYYEAALKHADILLSILNKVKGRLG